jgi:parvulin-like peptidyl-prolyl isomerase
MAFRTRRVAALAGVALLAGCGSGSKLASGQIAVVCGEPVTRAQFDAFLHQGKTVYKLQKQTFPAVGSKDYETLKQRIVQLLVEHAEQREAAAKMGIHVSDAQVAKELQRIVDAQFKGDRKALEQTAATQGLTPQDVHDAVASSLLQKAIKAKVTAKLKVGNAEIQAYYEKNKAQYRTRPSRPMREILVKTKAQADALEAELRGGADFTTLARRSSIDPSGKAAGGKIVLEQGTMAPVDDSTAFTTPLGQVTKPLRKGSGWVILKPLGPVRAQQQIPLAQVQMPIVQFLLGQKQGRAVKAWMDGVKKGCAKGARYAKGFAPPKS